MSEARIATNFERRKVTGVRAGAGVVLGCCAVLAPDGPGSAVALVAPDLDALRQAWDRLANIPLDESRVQWVGLMGYGSFSHD